MRAGERCVIPSSRRSASAAGARAPAVAPLALVLAAASFALALVVAPFAIAQARAAGVHATFSPRAQEGPGCTAASAQMREVDLYDARIEIDGEVVALVPSTLSGFGEQRATLRFALPGQRCTLSGELATGAAIASPRNSAALDELQQASESYAAAQALIDEGRASGGASSATLALAIRTRILGEAHAATLACTLQSIATRARTNDATLAADIAAFDAKLASTPERLAPLAAGLSHVRAISAFDAGDYAVAARESAAAADARSRLLGPDHIDTLSSRALLAAIRDEQGALDDAAAITEDVLARRIRVLGLRHPQTIGSENNLAALREAQGRLTEALALYRRAVEDGTAALGAASPFVEDATINLAGIELSLGREATALPRLEAARRAQVDALGALHARTIRTTMALGEAYARLGRFDDALAIYRDAHAAATHERGEDSPVALALAFRLADLLRIRGDADTARPLAARVLAARSRSLGASHPQTIAALALRANIEWVAGEFDAAHEWFGRAIDTGTAASGPDDPDVLFHRYQRALLDAEHGRPADALTAIRDVRSRQAARQGAAHPRTQNSLALEGRLQAGAGDRRSARAALEEVVATVERRRDEGASLSVENRQSLFARNASDYALLARLRVMDGNADGAFALSEQAKARTLLETLAQRRADTNGQLPVEERDRLAEYDARIARLAEAIARSRNDASAVLRLETERNDLLREVAAVRARLIARYPRYGRQASVRRITAEEGRALLAPESAFLSYQLDGDRVLAFTLTRLQGLRAVDLGAVPKLGEAIAAWRALALRERDSAADPMPVWRLPDGTFVRSLSRPGANAKRVTDTREISRWLARRLLVPLAALTPARRWIVSPDGPLAFLPFEALPWRGSTVAQSKIVSYIQSLSVLALVRAGRDDRAGPVPRKSLLAFGAADYSATVLSTPMTPGARDPARSWPALPGARAELAGAAAAFAPPDRDLVIGAEATKPTLLAMNRTHALAGYRLLLFAAHGYLDARSPELSALVLGKGDPTDPADGEVTVGDWTNFDLASDLVMLSACETALGREIRGEGVTGLPYALYVAGNRNAVLSLWNVADAASAPFVRQFFARLARGERDVDALAAVKREFLRDPRYSAPFFWAPFVLYGG